MMKIDFLIIGQGLAGSLLAWELIKRNCKIMVIDNGQENASKVAAGLINPITGKRLTKEPNIDALLLTAKTTYQQLGDFFDQDFYIEKSMRRILRNQTEVEYAQKRYQQPNYSSYLSEIKFDNTVYAPLGSIYQSQTAYLLTRLLLEQIRRFLIQHQAYQLAEFNYHACQLKPHLQWQAFQPDKIIFCEGQLARYNPWFKDLPFQVAKGEILTLESGIVLADEMLNYGYWMIPLTDYLFRTGATFDTQHLNEICTDTAKQELYQQLQLYYPQLTDIKFIKHQAHIRPCTMDKAAFIGIHQDYSNLAIFNGFGSKGCLQIPYYSQQFADYLLNQQPLDRKINCQRYR